MLPARLDAVLVATDDLAGHRAFYEALGWRSTAPPDAPFVPFGLDGAAFALWTRELAEEVARPCRDAGIEFRDVGLLIVVATRDEVDAAAAAAGRAGARILSGPVERPSGLYSVWFADPQAVAWEVVTNVTPRPRQSGPDALVPRLSAVTRVTDDVLALRDFYEAGLGWPTRTERREDIVQFQLATAVFSGWTAREAEPEIAAPLAGAGFPFRGYTLGIAVESADRVDAGIAHARASGATIVAEPVDHWWGGRSGYFADPAGIPWEVVWIPAARIDERGRLRLG